MSMNNNLSIIRNISGDVSTKTQSSGGVQKPLVVREYVFELEFDNKENFPIIGDEDKLYIATDENVIYRWDSNSARYIPLTAKDVSYNDLTNKPSLNGVPIEGDKTNEEYGIDSISNFELEELLK